MFNGDKLRELRMREGLTGEELGAKIFVTQQAVAKWEHGRAIPNANNVKALADVFGVSMDVFFEKQRLSPNQFSAAGE
jgi:transcriptional regulator with XRE-family HTH domain